MRRVSFFAMLLVLTAAMATVAIAADLRIHIVFDTETDSTRFVQGEPVVVSVVISSPTAMNAHYENITSGRDDKKAPIITLGSPAEPWVDSVKFTLLDSNGVAVPIRIYPNPVKENMVAIDAETFAEARFFIDSDESTRLKEGDYSIRARVKDVESGALALRVVKEGRTEEPLSRSLKFGRYHLLRGDFQKAAGYAYKVLAVDAHSLKGLDLLGDAFTGLGRYKEAYETFDKAIREYIIQYPPSKDPSSYANPPELFFEKRNKAKRLLAQP
jgi:hypothetical protein